jgi:hypothetical protein
VAADYQQRDKSAPSHAFPHIWTPYADGVNSQFSYRNIFDESFIISSTYDAQVKIILNIIDAAGGASLLGASTLAKMELGTIPASNGTTPQIMILAPDLSATSLTGAVAVAVPELRQPLPAFSIQIAPIDAPTMGEIKIMNIRRY